MWIHIFIHNVHVRFCNLKLNSWTYSFIEVSHGFLKPKGRGCGFLSGFPPFSLTVYSNWTVETVRGCVSLKKHKSQGKALEVTVWIARRKLLRLLSEFRPRILIVLWPQGFLQEIFWYRFVFQCNFLQFFFKSVLLINRVQSILSNIYNLISNPSNMNNIWLCHLKVLTNEKRCWLKVVAFDRSPFKQFTLRF